MRPGAQSVMNTGQPMLSMWSADNWDSWILVLEFYIQGYHYIFSTVSLG